MLKSHPFQKLAQRDQQAMVELLQICCLMNYIFPKVQSHLGAGKMLDGIVDQWKMGCLRLQVLVKTMHFWVADSGSQK